MPGPMTFPAPVSRPPQPALRDTLSRGYQGWLRPHDRAGRFVLPASLSVQMVVKVEDSALRPPEFVNGVADAHSAIEGGCAPRYVQIVLSPLGAYQVCGLPLEKLTGRLVDLHDVFGPGARRLGEQVREQPTWARRFDLLDRFLIRRLESAPPVSREVRYAWQRLTATAGAVRIAALCREVGWSHKHLITRFREQVGVTPKRAARLSRFEHLLRRLDRERPRPDWDRLAAVAGYADQAHMIRDFGQFLGTTPTKYLAAASGAR
jgi:AraC-like DNA-binding protein